MRHKKAVAKLGRTKEHRKAMLRNMVTSFFEHEKIKTTNAKAKELRRIVEKMITLAKRGDLHARRQALSYIRKKGVTAKLFEEIAKRYEGRNGGYTRIIKLGNRQGDNAPISFIELVGKEDKGKKPRKRTRERGKKSEKAAPAREVKAEVAEEEAAEMEVAEAEIIEEAAPAEEEAVPEVEEAEEVMEPVTPEQPEAAAPEEPKEEPKEEAAKEQEAKEEEVKEEK
jgi:large subunit ribosomal protein L17